MNSKEPWELDRDDMVSLQAGRDTALNELMDRHGERLFHYLIRQLQNESEAADLAQETFVRIFQYRNRYNPEQKFSTWLYAIAGNLVRDRYRWRTRHPSVSIDAEQAGGSPLRDHLAAESPGPDETLGHEEDAAVIRAAVARLPERLRTPLLLSEFENLSHAEIGATLGCSVKAVESKLYRARQLLKKSLLAFEQTRT